MPGREPARIRILFQDDVAANRQFLEPIGTKTEGMVAIGVSVAVDFDQTLLHHQHVVGQVFQQVRRGFIELPSARCGDRSPRRI